MKDKKVLVYSLATQYENLGDILINRLLIGWLSESSTVVIEDKGVEDWFVKCVAGNAAIKASEEKSKYSIKSGEFYQSIFLEKPYINSIVLSPGHLGNSTWKMDLKKMTVLIAAIILKIKRISIYRFGVSLGNLSIFGRLMESLSAMLFSGYSVRDSHSKSKLYGFAQKYCVVMPDLSFLAYKKLSVIKTVNSEFSSVLFSVRGDRNYPRATKRYEEMIYNVIPKQLCKCFQKVVCYSQVKFDAEVQHRIKNELSDNHDNVSYVEEYTDLDAACSKIQQSSIVVSNRLHVLLPAMMLGKCAIFVGSAELDGKIVSIFKDMGLIDLFYDVENETDEFDAFLSSVIADEKSISLRISDAVNAQENTLRNVINNFSLC